MELSFLGLVFAVCSAQLAAAALLDQREKATSGKKKVSLRYWIL